MNLDKDWDWNHISSHCCVTWDIIQAHPTIPWNWYCVAYNPNITIAIILENPDIPWDWNLVSKNPNMTMNFIRMNPDKDWDWNIISSNPFTTQRTDFLVEQYKRHLMAFRIQYRWKNALVNPHCQLGIRKIERDMEFAGIE